ncbi:IS110 family transposase [Paenibacillus sp. TCA20]|uniref:IS110 family transposase n=1 Tax=Paenibacillus sp. TCA20 TaxID=1499968 RepID=UPI00064C4C92|nr:IS110 family transposase [Paenibacillus sp. TCA20]
MEVLLPRCAGLDVHKETIVACVLIGEADQTLRSETKTFPTMTRDLFALMTWLESEGVTHIAMESTGIYWKPVYNILEGYFDIALANAQRIKNVPGRKTDVSDAEWIAKLLRVGLIEKSFVPAEDLRELRDLTRLRKKRVGNLTAEKNRIQKMLEASNVKLGTVISDVFGVSGRNLLARLMEQGYVDADDIEHRVHGNVKRNVKRVAESLFGTLNTHQMLMIRNCWEHIAFLEQSIAALDAEIEAHLKPYQEAQVLIQTIPGVSDVTAAAIIAEIGVDMEQFPTAAHLASWAGVAPGNHESAGKKKRTHTRKGNPHVKTALCEAAWAATKCRKSGLSVRFWKLAARRGKKKAIIALARKILTIIYMMLKTKIAYVEGGPESARPVA